MAIHDIWLANLKTLVSREGGGRKGIRSVAQIAGLSEEYVYQLVEEKPNKIGIRREIGKNAAKKIDTRFAFGRPEGWFDQPIGPGGKFSPSEPMPSFHRNIFLEVNAEPAGAPRHARPTPVVGTAKMGDGGYYEALDYPTGQGDGWVDSYSPDPNAYALRVKGDSMHPAIRHGSFVVVEPNGRCVPGEFVAIVLRDGRKMVKELVIEREHEIVIESVNGNQRQTLERSEIEKMHPIAAVVAASRWRQG